MERILIFSTAYLPMVGGAEIAIKELSDRLSDYEFDLIAAKIKPGLPEVEKIGRVKVYRTGMGSPIDKFLLPEQAYRKAVELQKEHGYDAIWVMMASYAAFGAERFKNRFPGVPMLLTLQEGDPPEYIAKKVRLVKGWFRNIFRAADGLQTISNFLMEWGLSQGFQGSVAEVIPNGVDLEKFSVTLTSEDRNAIRSKYGLKPEDFVVVTTSRLVIKNGIDLMIRALSKSPRRIKLLIAGTGELEDELKSLAKECGVSDRVVFTGMVEHDKLPKLLSACDAFCRPSRSEGLGISFIEAMAVGLPTIGTPVGGIPDIINHGENGIMVEPESPESIANAFTKISSDVVFRKKISEAGRQFVRNYDWNKVADEMNEIFRSIIETKSKNQ